MDQSYRLHKWLGIAAMVFILLHDTIDAEMKSLGGQNALAELAETLGEISLYGLLILVVITIATFIPYHLWKWTHRFIGIFFVLGAAHYLFILKPFKNAEPLGIYMACVCGIGILAYIYTSAPRRLRPSKTYQITSLTNEGSALAVEMKPESRSLRHSAGQFAFFAFEGANLPEPHPFTISNAPRQDGSLRVTIAPLGDLTLRYIQALAVGQSVKIDGPYGRFGSVRTGEEVWIAAGVGVTPFLALAESLSTKDSNTQINMVYCIRNRIDAAHIDQLEKLSQENPNLQLTIWESKSRGRLTADAIAEIVGDNIQKTKVLFCGPKEMRVALQHGLRDHGITSRQFHFEAFEIRTGLGLRRLIARFGGPRLNGVIKRNLA